MKKNLVRKLGLLALVVGLNSSVVHSQVILSLLFGDALNSEKIEFGLEGGFNWSAISDLDSSERLRTFNLGFYFDIKLKNQLNFYTGVLVKSNLGIDELSMNDLSLLDIEPQEEEGTYSQRLNYFLVPALIKYNFRNHMYLEAGPQFGLMHKARVEFESSNDDREILIKEFNKDQINRFDAGFVVGTGLKLMKGTGMSIGVKYYFGLVDVYKDISGTKNSSLFLKMNIPVGGVKDDEEKVDPSGSD